MRCVVCYGWMNPEGGVRENGLTIHTCNMCQSKYDINFNLVQRVEYSPARVYNNKFDCHHELHTVYYPDGTFQCYYCTHCHLLIDKDKAKPFKKI